MLLCYIGFLIFLWDYAEYLYWFNGVGKMLIITLKFWDSTNGPVISILRTLTSASSQLARRVGWPLLSPPKQEEFLSDSPTISTSMTMTTFILLTAVSDIREGMYCKISDVLFSWTKSFDISEFMWVLKLVFTILQALHAGCFLNRVIRACVKVWF